MTTKQKTTEEALTKLQDSREYRQYLIDKENPNSRYNRKRDYDDVSEIYLSDDSDDERNKKKK